LPLQGSAGNAFGRGSSKDRFRSSRQLRHPVRINVSPIPIWAMDSLLTPTRSDAPLDLPRSKLSTAYRGAKTCWQFPRHRQRQPNGGDGKRPRMQPGWPNQLGRGVSMLMSGVNCLRTLF
jgi:hypothetical protein